MSSRFVTLVVLVAYFASPGGAQFASSHRKRPEKTQASVQAKLADNSPTEQQNGTLPALNPEAQPPVKAVLQPVAPSTGPTLAETTQWIESHITGLTHGRSQTMVTFRLRKGKPPKEESRQNVSSTESVSVAKFEGCVLTLGQLTRGDDYTVVTLSTVPLDRLTSASWKVEELKSSRNEAKDEVVETTIVPSSVALLSLEGSTNVIGFRRRSTGSIPLEWIKTPFEGAQSTLVIRSDDREMPPRLVNAFNHAIQLCHKDLKPEPF
jgi:hypothetical protein